MKNIFTEPQAREVTLADGKAYKLSPLNLNVLATLEEEFDCGLDKVLDKFEGGQASALRTLLYALLKENYPEFDKQQVGKLVNTENLTEVSDVITESFSDIKVSTKEDKT